MRRIFAIMISPTPKVLFVTQDAGGFRAVVPVYRWLQRDRRFFIRGLFGKARNLEATFDRFRPTLVVTGPSAGWSLDKQALVIAKGRNIPTMTILDFGGNLETLLTAPDRDVPLADTICVMNDLVRKDLIAWGCPKTRIIVTGNPGFDDIARRPSKRPKNGPVLFIEQPFTELEYAFPGSGFGLDERRVFADLVASLATVDLTRKVIVRFHPRTKDRKKFDDIIHASRLDVVIDGKTPLSTLMQKSALVLGMNSTALLEACARGIPVVSYQPGLVGTDPLPTNRAKITRCLRTSQELTRALAASLQTGGTKSSASALEKVIPRHATKAVIRQIQRITRV
jgi:hypothetical protein